jgi:mannonate dehydratase
MKSDTAASHQAAREAVWNPSSPRMHVGTQRFTTSDEHLEFLARHGVKSMSVSDLSFDRERGWDVEELIRKRKKCARHGIDMEMVELPIRTLNRDGEIVPHYMRGHWQEGEREIDLVCRMIRAAAEAGIAAIKYFLCEMENQRTESVPLGRGGARYSTWDLAKADADTPRYDAPVTAEQNWARITFFLERVIPVATECKVRMACHPCDPWLPPGYKGVDRVLGGAEGFKRLIEICPSPYHGLNLCLGCMAESVLDPRNEVPDIIRYFGERKKIHLIHFRNIVGGRNKFQEVWPDEGVMNMHTLMVALKEVGYPHMVVPDHAPQHAAPGSFEQAFAYQFGYIQAMIQAVQSEN